MPPKSQVGTSPVYSMEHEEQVRLLSDALLREYMHKKGFRKTLSVFDQEHPRDKDTISSRAVMADLMALLPEEQQRLKGEGIETIMEMLCDLRIERRQAVEALEAKASMPIPEVPHECLTIIAKHNQKAAEKKDRLAAKQQRAEAKKVKETIQRQSNTGTKAEGHLRAVIPLEKEMTLDDLLESTEKAEPEEEIVPKKLPTGKPPRWLEEPISGGKKGTESVEKNRSSSNPANGAISAADLEEKDRVGDRYEEAREGGEPCPTEHLRSAYCLLCGFRPAPPASFVQQGISFDDAVGFRLIQWAKGPGAVISPIQAFIVGFYFERSFVESQEHQRHARLRALSHILLAAQPDPSRIVLVDGLFSLKHPTYKFLDQMNSHFLQWTSFQSVKEMEDRLFELVQEHWERPKGSGIWCFLMSLVLSRGISLIEADGVSSGVPLINESGFGTPRMLNLCLCGAATGASSSKEYNIHMQCGILFGDVDLPSPSRSEDFPPVGSPANPMLPSWVIRHGSHYSNLFMKKDTRKVFVQKRELGGSATVQLTYWDPLTEDDETTLEVQVGGAAWGGRRLHSSSYVNTAILSVPPWSAGVVDWKGATPPL